MPGWTGVRNLLYKRPSPGAQVAQLVEQRTENPCVGGSIPPLGTIAFPRSPVFCCVAALAYIKGVRGMDGNNFDYEYRTTWRPHGPRPPSLRGFGTRPTGPGISNPSAISAPSGGSASPSDRGSAGPL